MHHRFWAASAAATLFMGTAQIASAQMPSWSPEQTAVWKVVEESWVDDVAQNGKWPADYADPQMLSWSAEFPSPRGKDSSIRWAKFGNSQSKTLQYDITPLAIALSGNTAVVSYTALVVSQRGTDKPDREKEAITETLVRSGGTWKYLATTSFSLGK